MQQEHYYFANKCEVKMKTLVLNLNNSKTIQEVSFLFKQGWETYRRNALPYSLYTLLSSGLMWALSSIPFASSLVFPLYMAGLYTAIKSSEEKEILTLTDFLNIEKVNFGAILKVGALTSLLTMIGFIAFIIPGAYAFCSYAFTTPLVLDANNKNLTAWEILEKSRGVFHSNSNLILVMMSSYFLISILALLPLGLGLFISTPFLACVNYSLYKKLK